MIPEPLLRWASTGAFDEHYMHLLYLRQQTKEAMEQEHRLIMAIHGESDKRLELLQNFYSPTPILKDVIDEVLEKNK